MIQYVFSAFILVAALQCQGDKVREIAMQQLMSFAGEIKECSGLASLPDGSLVALNDSGNPAELFVFRLDEKDDFRSIEVTDAKNTDWEEMAEDSTFLYVGDFGNNHGDRQNLRIYRVRKDELMTEKEIKSDEIDFSFSGQSDFSKSEMTNFDCEAMVCIGDSLYLFTKNHGNLRSNLYSISKFPGKYEATYLGEIDAQGLITGADYRNTGQNEELVLVGYTDRMHGHIPFVMYFKAFDRMDLAGLPVQRFRMAGQAQIESILFYGPSEVLVASEGKKKEDRNVYLLSL